MDALVIHAAGDLRVEDIPTPAIGARQALVRVRTGGICGSDLHYFQHGGFGSVRIQQPMVLGHEVAGVIDAPHFQHCVNAPSISSPHCAHTQRWNGGWRSWCSSARAAST